ncbi:MAG TPA: FAD-dependent monooxygenase, partial [Nannocystis sp.]
GRQEEYDLVVIAEGVGSSTRELVFAGENRPRWIDLTMGYFTIPKAAGDSEVARWFTAGGGRSVLLRPDKRGTTRALLNFQAPPQGEDRLELAAQKALLRRRFADAGWETPRVLDGLDSSTDFYMDVLRQVKLARWSKGRVVLTGDAAWCATPLSGIGTTLAIVGPYVLAGELCKQADIAGALAEYERIMRPYVHKGQDFPKFMARMAQPRSRLGVRLQGALLGVAAAPGLRKLVAKLFSPAADDVELQDYRI